MSATVVQQSCISIKSRLPTALPKTTAVPHELIFCSAFFLITLVPEKEKDLFCLGKTDNTFPLGWYFITFRELQYAEELWSLGPTENGDKMIFSQDVNSKHCKSS